MRLIIFSAMKSSLNREVVSSEGWSLRGVLPYVILSAKDTDAIG